MKQDNLPEVPAEKYNSWCQRRPLICADREKCDRATSFFGHHHLSSSERAAFYLHELTGCAGLEFVAFSNAELGGFIKLPGNVLLVPCFLATSDGHNINNPLVQLTIKMKDRSRFVYDGWIPIQTWDEHHIRQAVQNIDKALSVFCMEARVFFHWEPKYPASSERHSVILLKKSTSKIWEMHLEPSMT